ncbi:uncharacterized protein LOC111032207 [Myzus persicae]|uniref:uncharacterized protein LOC111026805 n=1 Tax=Myzus persicae TaxID=13164 RepID=UPI000B93536A|nr:uncharacterized protein LOC111026805 [Myzus persicae]XP_022168146.1 uncharacterized protein LOC111032207 [Myzus persicae]
MPSVSILKRTVRRIRQKEQAAPPNPKTLLELIIPDDYRSTFDGNPFLLFDSGLVENRILIFSTQKNLQLLQKCEHWFADGTFSTSPNLFYQIYTVHGIQFNNVFPTIFALLPNKTETTYVNFYNALKTLNESLNPKSIMVDFEKAAINAIQSVFTNTSVRGCFFHLSQSIWRRLQNLGFQNRYMEDSEFALQIRMMAALTFVPEEDVENAWNELLDSEFYSLNEEILTPLTNYFEDTWIGRLDRRNRRKPALFPVTLWNCHKYIFENIPRTNNSVEGWHNGFASSLNACHPTIWKCIDSFKKEESLMKLQIEQLIAGMTMGVKRKYKDHAEKIIKICDDYHSRSKIDFLKGIAHNFQLQL